jgi:raffinose/stachyose/melibiose transport system substrate-binding protein
MIMRHRSVRYLALVAVALGLVTAGCSSGSPSSSNSSGPATITVWEWGSPGAAISTLTTDFEKAYPSIKVKLVVQPFNSYFTLLRTAVASHKGPDVVEIYASPYVFDYSQGLLPLTSYATPQQKAQLLGWNLVSTGMSNSGTPYAVPWTGQGINFYYNKKLFSDAGLNPNDPPTTWSALLADSKALKAHGIVPIVAGFQDGYYGEWWGDILSGQLMTAAQASSPSPNWTNPALVTALTDMVSLYKDGYMTPNAAGIPLFPNTVNNFAAGKGAIFLGLAANNANWSQFKSTLGNNLGTFREPSIPGDRYGGNWFDYAPGLAWSVTKWTAHPSQDYTYLSYLAKASSQTKAFPLDGTLPNTRLSVSTSTYAPASEILGWVRTSVLFPGQVTLIRANVEATYDKMIPEVVTGALSVKAGLQQVEATQQATPPIPPA